MSTRKGMPENVTLTLAEIRDELARALDEAQREADAIQLLAYGTWEALGTSTAQTRQRSYVRRLYSSGRRRMGC